MINLQFSGQFLLNQPVRPSTPVTDYSTLPKHHLVSPVYHLVSAMYHLVSTAYQSPPFAYCRHLPRVYIEALELHSISSRSCNSSHCKAHNTASTPLSPDVIWKPRQVFVIILLLKNLGRQLRMDLSNAGMLYWMPFQSDDCQKLHFVGIMNEAWSRDLSLFKAKEETFNKTWPFQWSSSEAEKTVVVLNSYLKYCTFVDRKSVRRFQKGRTRVY